MENNLAQKNIASIMHHAFEHAAQSFSGIVHSPVSCQHSKMVTEKVKDEFTGRNKHSKLTVLTTDMIGELSGRSYMILSESDRDKISMLVSLNGKASVEMEEAFLKEIDNITSAAVISQLANILGIELFGDVPQVLYTQAGDLESFFSSSIHDSPTGCLFCTTTFMVERLRAELQFVWKLNSKILNLVNQSLTHKS